MDNYMTAEELESVIEYVNSLQPLWDALTGGARGGVSVECESMELFVYDSNGEKLGRIAWADSGPAFYPGDE